MLIKSIRLITVFSLILFVAGILGAQIPASNNIAVSDRSTSTESEVNKVNIDEVTAEAESQTNETKLRKFEVGGQVTIMFQDDFEPLDVVLINNGFPESAYIDHRYESGFGGRFTYNINRNLAIETELNFIPGTPTAQEIIQTGSIRTGPFSGGEKTQVLFGAKYGYRGKRFGIFGKVRPGFIHFNAFPYVTATFIVRDQTGQPYDILVLSSEKPATFFNVDVGGVVEYYPTKRTIIRFDIGDTIIRYNKQEPKEFNPTFTRHNLQMSLGFGFRF